MQGGHGALSLGTLVRPAQRAWGLAARTFQQHPLLVKTVTSGMGFAFGDVLFQLGAAPRGRPRTVDWARAAKMGGAGLAGASVRAWGGLGFRV